MSEILFRGMTEKGDWAYGVPLKTKYSALTSMICELTDDSIESFLVKPETVEQYTGLKDKNGTKIFKRNAIEVLERQLSTSKQSNSDLEDMLVALKEEHEEEVKSLERQLEEAIEIAENAVEKWRDTADSYGVYYGEIELEEIKLKNLKEKGDD